MAKKITTKTTKAVVAPIAKTIAEGGAPNYKASPLEELGNKLVELTNEANELKEKQDKIKKELASVEELLIDRMVESQVQKISVQNRTLYLQKRTIVSRAKGVTAEDFYDTIRGVGLGEIISDSVNAGTLKAIVTEYREKAKAKGQTDFAVKCFECDEFLSDRTELEADAMKAAAELAKKPCKCCGESGKILPVFYGVPLALSRQLFVDENMEIGNRSAG